MQVMPKIKEHLSIFQKAINAHLELRSEMTELPDNFYSVGVDMNPLNPDELFELRTMREAGLVEIDYEKRAYWLTQKGAEFAREIYEQQRERAG